MGRPIFTDEHEMFRSAYRAFLDREVVPRAAEWEREGIVSRDVWTSAGASGFLAFEVPEAFGGPGVEDFRYNLVVVEELADAGVMAAGAGFTLHNDVTLPYFMKYCTPEQQERWLPGIADGSLITAVAMTEPGMGSDLASMSTTAIRDGDTYVLNGSKTFITNGYLAGVILLVVKTDPEQGAKGTSILIVETKDCAGFRVGRILDKIGLKAQDTSELFFDDVSVPSDCLLGGREGQGFFQLMADLPYERTIIGVLAAAAMEGAYEATLDYVRQRNAFGRPVAEFQNTRFRLAEIATTLKVARTFVDRCVTELVAGTLDTVTASMVKLWTAEQQGRVIDECVQLHGGYGFMSEYLVARMYADARVQRIYGGTSEIMKEVISRGL